MGTGVVEKCLTVLLFTISFKNQSDRSFISSTGYLKNESRATNLGFISSPQFKLPIASQSLLNKVSILQIQTQTYNTEILTIPYINYFVLCHKVRVDGFIHQPPKLINQVLHLD